VRALAPDSLLESAPVEHVTLERASLVTELGEQVAPDKAGGAGDKGRIVHWAR
jgi:hypothetical protein